MKIIKMLNVKENKEIIFNINIADKKIEILNNETKEKLFDKKCINKEELNKLIINMINNHFNNNYVIISMNIL